MLPEWAEDLATILMTAANIGMAWFAGWAAITYNRQQRRSVVAANRMRNVEEFEEIANHIVQFVSAKRLYMGFACRPLGEPSSLPGSVALSGVYDDIQKQREELDRLQSRLKLLSMRIGGDAPSAAEDILEIHAYLEGAALAVPHGDVRIDDAWLDCLAYKPGDAYSEKLTRALQTAASLYAEEFGKAK